MTRLFSRRERPAPPGEEAARREVETLTASRRAIVDAYEVERRRIQRDLHDGTQQYLVAAAMKLGEAQLSPAVADEPELNTLLREAKDAVQRGLDALRITVRGIHPQALSELGLEAAVRDAATACPVDVRVMCPHRLPEISEGVVAAAYFFTAEALTNAVKHAPNSSVTVLLAADATLTVSVVDSGPGGATLTPGRGLAGMRERLAAFGGTLDLSSPPGGPTQVVAHIPLLLTRGQPGVVVEGAG